KLRIDNQDVLERFPTGAFITVSNHPFGSYDGILLLHLVGAYRKDYKVMVNLILNQIQAMRPNFIAVDPLQSDDPEKKKITMQGIRAAMKHVRDGHPLGFFPAGAISKLHKNLRIEDREWQPSIIRLIHQMKVPVIPIYFHGHNSLFFNILGMIDWRLRTLRLPKELFRKYGKEVWVSFGEPVSVEEQNACSTTEDLGRLLRERTYALR
ncbi:MAG: 1-acyl-sn-glycerol-3-phosphate acyltransferase, partial [Muribaculaceae bacterium]|nr:1-acyl-sn-glycerol-3-phosphate acyltransferase [Muribaculaceae bacterium]